MADLQHIATEPSSLRVLHVVSGDLWAGAEVQVFQTVRALATQPCIDVRVALMNSGLLAERLSGEGIRVYVLDERSHGVLALAVELTRIARSWRPDIVHTHRRKEHLLGAIISLRTDARAVATIHGRSEFNYPWWNLRAAALRFTERLVLRTVPRRLIAVSEEVGASLPGPRERTTLISNGINVDEVRKILSGRPSNRVRKRASKELVFVGRLVEVKQVDRVIDTLGALLAESPEEWRLTIVGDGPLRKKLEQHARDAGVAGSVEFTGFLTDPLPLLAEADALLFASLHEGLPMTALEALALGVPVVSPPLPGLERLIKKSGHGVIARSPDPVDLARAIRAAIKCLGSADRPRPPCVPTEYNVHSTAKRLIGLYREV